MMSRIDCRHWKISASRHFQNDATIPHKFNIVRFQRHFICEYIMMSRIDSWHRKISTGRHFQNGHHNTAQIQHCPISTTVHMWVDYDVPKWFLTLKNFYRSPFSKWLPQYCTNSTLSDFNDISYVGRLWCPEMIPDIKKFLPVAIFKMATTIPQKFNIVRFLPVSIFKMATTIPQKFNIVQFQR